MFEVTVKVMGKPAQVLEVSEGATIAQAQELMGLEGNYTFNLGGKPATKEAILSEGAYVVFAPSVKGAAKKLVTKKVVAKKVVAKKVVAKPTKKPAKKK